ncbi:STM4504/CBY_0614 family protein [Pseudomonas viridiflava]|uniref:STM4504/CBY_0614 family protein n=2 Tax=Pseudomonas viridiflava TaxID=33069 RepID=UPI000F04022F|nr:hypothetical protein [Pseudomonas viridiflava]
MDDDTHGLWHHRAITQMELTVPIHDIYSKRKRRLSGDAPDVYTYDALPTALRNQIVFVLKDLLGNVFKGIHREDICTYAATSIAREWGKAYVVDHADLYSWEGQLLEVIRRDPETDHSLDVIEFLFGFAENAASNNTEYCPYKAIEKLAPCIEELNHRFKENGVGYEYSDGQIIRVDSMLLHGEVVKPALQLLGVAGFEGPQEEFLDAHEHYRHKRYKEALVSGLKSFESTMKVISERKVFPFKRTDTAKKLILVCMENGLFPSYYQSHLSALANLLEGGVPSIRNNEAGHGQGAAVKEIAPHVVAYTLHMTAAAIVLLANSYLELEDK